MAPRPKTGDLLTVNWDDDGTFRVAKVLATESHGIHLRVYAERFPQRPRERPAELTLGTIDDDDSFGAGHIPLSWADFERWQPERIGAEPVEAAELDGYEIWKEMTEGDSESFFEPSAPERRSVWDRLRKR